ncbi:MAG: hypothetical protein MZV64_38635 [Ignavibacteriales bacterium]|nr:hypothetical protein [Ignavibacteriales bacterium]
MMSNTGPFTLTKGDEKEIVVAYVFGQGSDAKNSVTVAKRIDDGAQKMYDNNFIAPSSPPLPNPEISSGPDFIDLVWNTKIRSVIKEKLLHMILSSRVIMFLLIKQIQPLIL